MSTGQVSDNQRITFKHKRPNPLFQEWLEKLHDDAKTNNSKIEPMLREALTSLSKYPLPLKTGAECAILKGFNVKLCSYLDKFLQIYNSSEDQQNVEQVPENSGKRAKTEIKRGKVKKPDPDEGTSIETKSPVRIQSPEKNIEVRSKSNAQTSLNSQADLPCTSKTESNSQSPTSQTKKSKERIYRPGYRSGAYAILIALLEHLQECPDDPALMKENIIEKAQKHSEESFVRPKPESFYTAWSNITRLVTKGLVMKTKKKKMYYSLTGPGILLATELLKESANRATVNDIIFNNPTSGTSNQDVLSSKTSQADTDSISSQLTASQCSNASGTAVEMLAGSFDVILLIDKNETGG